MVKKSKKVFKKISFQGNLKKPKPETEPIKKTKIRVIGIGGGGNAIVSEIASRIKKASFVVANTDLRALKIANRKTLRFQFGQNFTRGLGTGMSVEVGREAALNEKERIKKLLKGFDLCILTACLGGGTGSGAAPVFAKIAKNLGIITYGIFTLPFKFEGEKKMEIARASLLKLKPNLNAISILPNERIFQVIDKSTPLKEALSTINKSLTEGLEGLIETIYLPGLINIDFADLKTILDSDPPTARQGKLAYLNTVEVQGNNRSLESIKKVLNSPLYPYTIKGARGVLFNIAGQKDLSLAEVSQISKTISELVNPEAKIIFGVSQGKKYQNKIKVTLLATGCGLRFSQRLREAFQEEKEKVRFKPKKTKKTLRLKKKKLRKKSKIKAVKKVKKIKTTSFQSSSGAQSKKSMKEVKPEKRAIKTGKSIRIKIKPSQISSDQTPEGKTEASSPSTQELKPELNPLLFQTGAKVRKNGLQIKKEAEEQEKEILKEEEKWETPAFLRRKKSDANY